MAKLTIYTSTTSQSIPNNYSKVRVQLVLDTTMNPYSFNNDTCNGWVKIDGTKYNFSSKWKQKAKTTIYDSTKTIYHNSDGNKTLSINASFNGETSEVGTVTASTSVKLKQIYRNSVLNNLTDSKGSWEFDVGTSFGVKITKYNSSYTDTLTLKIKSDGTTLKTISNISTGNTITFTDDEIDLMYQKTPNSKICELSYTLTTKNGSTTIGSSSGTIKGYINVPPTIQSISLQPDNITKELTGVTVAPYKYIKNYSSVNVIATAVGNKYATIDHFTVGSSIYQATNGSATFEISKISSKDLIVYAVDSRTNETSQTTTLDLLEYNSITKGTQSSSRKNNIEEETTISFNGKFWNNNFGSVQNTLTASYKYKISGSSTWTTGTSTITPTFDENGNFQFSGSIKGDKETGFDIANSYDIEVVVKDKLTEISYTYLINSGKPAIAVYKSNVAIGDKYNEELGGNQLWGDIYLNGKEINKNIITARPTTYTSSTKQSIMPMNNKIIIGNKLSVENNAIVIGSGVSKVKVSANGQFVNQSTTYNMNVEINIMVNDSNDYVAINYFGTSRYATASISDFVMNVKEGDKIQLRLWNNAAGNYEVRYSGTWLTIEVVE